jgi:hypothetical protein
MPFVLTEIARLGDFHYMQTCENNIAVSTDFRLRSSPKAGVRNDGVGTACDKPSEERVGFGRD